MRNDVDPKLAKRFEAMLSDAEVKENAFQDFLEEHTAFLQTPGLLHHQLHFNCVISKLAVGDWVTDFAYLSKTSNRWHLVLMELETPGKRIFKSSSRHGGFTSEFNDALAQVGAWRTHVDRCAEDVKRRLEPLLRPRPGNQLSTSFALVIGRSREMRDEQGRIDALARLETAQGVHVLTYDTLLDAYREGRGKAKCILSPKAGGFRIKRLDGRPWNLFSKVGPRCISIGKADLATLRDDGFDMDAWLEGRLLTAGVGGTAAIENTEENVGRMRDAIIAAHRKA